MNAQNNPSINMNINMNIDGGSAQEEQEPSHNSNMNINFNVQETKTAPPQANPIKSTQKKVIYVSGYTGKVGCTPPTSAKRIEDMAKTIKDKTFNDDKVRVTKQIIRTNCITLDQLIVLLKNFDWDDGKLEIAKFAYDYVYDIENYYKIYGLFTFSSSGEELEEYINSKN